MRPAAAITGRSFAAALRAGTEPLPRPIYGETLIWNLEVPQGLERRALVDRDDHKLVLTHLEGDGRASQTFELYDLVADPRELSDLAAADPVRRDRLAARLAALTDRLEGEAYQPVPIEMDEGTRERLRSLGYL